MPGPHRAVELVVGGVDHRAGGVEQRDLVAGLDHAGLLHQLLAVDDLDALRLQREQHRQLDHVDAERLAQQAALLELARGSCAATASARPGDIAPRSVEIPAASASSPSHGL